MSRVPETIPEQLDPEHRKLYDELVAKRPDRKLQGPSTLWIRNVKLANAANQMASVLRYEGKLDAQLFEMITLIVARDWSTHYVWVVHAKEAERVGLDPAIIEAIRARRVPAFANERQTVVYELAHELVETKKIADATHARALEMFGVDLILEIVSAVGFYTMICMTLNTFEAPAPGNVTPLA